MKLYRIDKQDTGLRRYCIDIERLSDKLDNYKRVLERLREAINEPEPNAYVYDAVVKRFEFVYELAWRCNRSSTLVKKWPSFLEQIWSLKDRSPVLKPVAISDHVEYLTFMNQTI